MCNYCKNVANLHRHRALIGLAAKECHNAIIFLRSANKFNERNLIPIGLRKTLVEDAVGQGVLIDQEESSSSDSWRVIRTDTYITLWYRKLWSTNILKYNKL